MYWIPGWPPKSIGYGYKAYGVGSGVYWLLFIFSWSWSYISLFCWIILLIISVCTRCSSFISKSYSSITPPCLLLLPEADSVDSPCILNMFLVPIVDCIGDWRVTRVTASVIPKLSMLCDFMWDYFPALLKKSPLDFLVIFLGTMLETFGLSSLLIC